MIDFTKLKVGDVLYYSGVLYTARDQAHFRLNQLLQEKKELPVDFKNSIIYYAGPTPTRPNEIIGSIGPTTSSRMDKFIDSMPILKIKGMIGKGPRNAHVKEICQQYKLVYFIVTGGAGALLASKVIEAKEVAFDDLGCESIKRLVVKNFPLIVAYDTNGNDLFERNL